MTGKLAADHKTLNICSDFHPRQPLLGYNRGFYEKLCLLLHAEIATVHLWTFIVRYRTVLEVPLSSSSMSCKCGTIFVNEKSSRRIIMEYGKKNCLPFSFSFVIRIGYDIREDLKHWAMAIRPMLVGVLVFLTYKLNHSVMFSRNRRI